MWLWGENITLKDMWLMHVWLSFSFSIYCLLSLSWSFPIRVWTPQLPSSSALYMMCIYIYIEREIANRFHRLSPLVRTLSLSLFFFLSLSLSISLSASFKNCLSLSLNLRGLLPPLALSLSLYPKFLCMDSVPPLSLYLSLSYAAPIGAFFCPEILAFTGFGARFLQPFPKSLVTIRYSSHTKNGR